jgi:hypothetical protein
MTFVDNNWPQPLVSASIKNPQSTGGRPFHFIKTDDFERPQSNHNVSISSSDLGLLTPFRRRRAGCRDRFLGAPPNWVVELGVGGLSHSFAELDL